MKLYFCVIFFVLNLPLAYSQTKPSNYVQVTGECLQSLSQDRASVTITADELSNTSQDSAQKVSNILTRFKTKLEKLNLKDQKIQTSEYTVREDFDWSNNKRRSLGFRVRMGYKIESSEMNRLSEVIQIAVNEGVKDIGQLTTFVSPEKMKKERESCLVLAVTNAKIKANSVATSLGAKLGKAMAIEESGGVQTNPTPRYEMLGKSMMAKSSSAVPEIEAATIDLSIFVSAKFELL